MGSSRPPNCFDNGWGRTHGLENGQRSVALAAGAYKLRVQYYDTGGDNRFDLKHVSFCPPRSSSPRRATPGRRFGPSCSITTRVSPRRTAGACTRSSTGPTAAAGDGVREGPGMGVGRRDRHPARRVARHRVVSGAEGRLALYARGIRRPLAEPERVEHQRDRLRPTVRRAGAGPAGQFWRN